MTHRTPRILLIPAVDQLVRGIIAAILCSVFSVGLGADSGPIIPRGNGDSCVAPNDEMRRNHMKFIMHQRDETVLKGIRDEPFSLSECVNCHAQHDTEGAPVRIDQEGQFCQSCHAYAAVRIDCFTCHRALPDDAEGDRMSQKQQ